VTSADLQDLHVLEAKIIRAEVALKSCIKLNRGCTSHVQTHTEPGTLPRKDSMMDEDSKNTPTAQVSIHQHAAIIEQLDQNHEYVAQQLRSLVQLSKRLDSTSRLVCYLIPSSP